MALRDIFKISFKTFFNPAAWFGYARVKGGMVDTWTIMKGLFLVPEAAPERTETFAEALKRHGLTEASAEELRKDYLLYAFLLLLIGAFVLGFGFYLFFVKKIFSGMLLGIAVSALFAAQAFRYHFWSFQIKQRKLGCSFQEWRDALLGDNKRSGA
jgi:intracellular multiplication protein IcmV